MHHENWRAIKIETDVKRQIFTCASVNYVQGYSNESWPAKPREEQISSITDEGI